MEIYECTKEERLGYSPMMDELVKDFVAETYESLQQLEQVILALESDPTQMEMIRDAFRLLHTIKGTCGFLGFSRMQSVAHRAENILSKMRDGELVATPVITSTIFVALDTIRQIVDHIEATGKESLGNDTDLLLALDSCLDSSSKTPPPSADKEEISDAVEDTGLQVEIAPADGTVTSPEIESVTSEQVDSDILAHDTVETTDTIIETVPQETEPSPTPEKPQETQKEASSQPQAAASAPTPGNTESKGGGSNQSIRISLDVVDNLMALVGELVLTRNQLLQQNEEAENSSVQNNILARLSHLTSDLQHNIMKTRMQPIETAWTKLPRLVRDIANSLNKKIQVKQIGADTELDRQVIELIKDPLVHMVRNSADHGIEGPDVRKTAGKNEVGTITLKSFHHGGHIVIEIGDDGKGIDPDVVRSKALEKNVISLAESDRMSDEQILQVIFRPGFSTADQISNISGRGVGMDVVRSNIDKLGGSIEMKSVKGVGSTFIMKIPLTLSIISVLLVKVSDQLFAIPQLAISEILSIKKSDKKNLEYVQNTPLLRWRNQLLPLISISDLLQINTVDEKNEQNIIIVQIGTQYFGFIVDSIHDSQEIVVKPLSRKLAHLTTYSGSTILGTGDVVLILDPNNFDLQFDTTRSTLFESQNQGKLDKSNKNTIILLFKSHGKIQAVPLALVGRIDEISTKEIEYIGGQYLFLYRGQLIPVMGFEGSENHEDDNLIPILIFADRGYKLALKIDSILDIIEDSTEIQMETSDSETLGTAVINGVATTVIDTQTYFKKAYPRWHEKQGHFVEPRPQRRLLLVDDSTFFLNLISPLLKVSGYFVKTASSADQGLKLCLESENPFDVIISDIEMPDKNGYDFLKDVQQYENLSQIPVVALSAIDTEEEIKRVRDAGFSEFVPKTDQQNLLRVLNQLCP